MRSPGVKKEKKNSNTRGTQRGEFKLQTLSCQTEKKKINKNNEKRKVKEYQSSFEKKRDTEIKTNKKKKKKKKRGGARWN